MDSTSFILASLRHYRRIHLAVALGVAVATAVLTGALLVGDSVRGSLRDLTLQRLGRIDTVVVAPYMFPTTLAKNMGERIRNSFPRYFVPKIQPAILLNGTLESGSGKNVRRATSVSVVGCEPDFWSFGEGGPAKPLADGEVAITQSLAEELSVNAGESVLLRIPAAGTLPADSPLGAKQADKTTRSRLLKVAAVLPPVGLARFGIMPSQQLPRNVFVPLDTLQHLLGKHETANTLFFERDSLDRASDDSAQALLHAVLLPRFQDLGLRLEWNYSPTMTERISSEALVLPDAVVRAAEKTLAPGKFQPVVTYLANTISTGNPSDERKIPYSTIVGVDSIAGIGPLLDNEGKPITLADDEIVLNRWAADDLKAKVGDKVAITFYEPESTHGKLRERQPPPVFKLRSIAELRTKEGKATAAADPSLTPEMPGVTDQKSIRDWDLPFELVEKIRPQDEAYWDEYHTTPKGFISLATAKRLFKSRWGTISLLRLPIAPTEVVLGVQLQPFIQAIDPASVGMQFLPVRRLGIEAAAGTTPFGVLFLAFSFFLIAAAVMLVALLFQLGIQQRMAELGTLAAVGVERRRIARLLSREGALVATAGATIGVVAGVLYAWLVIYALTHWWVAAISTPFLKLHIGWLSLVIGWLVGVVVSWLAIRWSIRKLVRLPVARLLAASTEGIADSVAWRAKQWKWLRWPVIRAVLLVLTILMCVAGFFMHGEEQAGIFFSSGAAVLALLLGEIRHRLRARGGESHKLFSLLRLSALNTARNPGRSTLTIGLVAAASFLIVAVSAFRLDTGEAGTGGFEYVATSDQPIHYDLNTVDGRRELGFSDKASWPIGVCTRYEWRRARMPVV
jgi:putative ABC transport system permease protein